MQLPWALLGSVPAPPCAAEPLGRTRQSVGLAGEHSQFRVGNWKLTGDFYHKEFCWSICKHRECPHHLPHSCIPASLTLSRFGFPVLNSQCDGLG